MEIALQYARRIPFNSRFFTLLKENVPLVALAIQYERNCLTEEDRNTIIGNAIEEKELKKPVYEIQTIDDVKQMIDFYEDNFLEIPEKDFIEMSEIATKEVDIEVLNILYEKNHEYFINKLDPLDFDICDIKELFVFSHVRVSKAEEHGFTSFTPIEPIIDSFAMSGDFLAIQALHEDLKVDVLTELKLICSKDNEIAKRVQNCTVPEFRRSIKVKEETEDTFYLSLKKKFESLQIKEATIYKDLRTVSLLMKELIDYSLICVGKSRYFKKEARSLELKESSLPGYLQTLAIRIPSATFYNQQTPGKWEKEWEATWRNILSLSLIRKPSFVAIGLLLRCAPNNLIMELAQPIVANIMDNETEECGSVLFLLFSRLANITHGVKSIDEIIFNVIRSLKSKDSAKFHVIVQALRSMKQAYDISSLGDIAKLVGFFFLPSGAKFVGNLLCDRRTIVYGLNILRMGIADQVFRSEFDVEHIDTIMDLMIVATNVIHSYFPINSWDKETIKFALNNLTNMRPGVNQQQIQHILALIKLLNTQAIAPIISQFKYLPNVISSLYGQ